MAETVQRGKPMTPAKNTAERLLQKRKLYVRSLVIATALLLLLFNLGSWLFLQRMGNYLERELEKHLTSIARLMQRNINNQYIDDLLSNNEPEFAVFFIQQDLRQLVDKEELQAAFIIDRNFVVLSDGGTGFGIEQRRTYLQQDSIAIWRAWQDSISASPIHIVAGNRFKNVYAPLKDASRDIVALLVLEANADFFEILSLFRRGLIIGGFISLGLIVVFSFFISWMISLLIRTQESLKQSEKLAAMGQMAASMAHEIRNPLGIIKSTADVLKEKYIDPDKTDELFDYISEEVKRLNHLVNNFLSFAREPKLELKSAWIENMIKKAVAAIEREDPDKTISVNFASSAELQPFLFDENAIQQVLFNMLINSIQAIDQVGVIAIDLTSINLKNKLYAKISISDNGTGIEGDVNKIFEPFYTTKSSGSGLGLAISKQIVEKHGGWIEVESQPGEGTTFRVFLPMKT
jgi:signal transduction histidine kinase